MNERVGEMSGKTCVVTGGTGGIGWVTARELAARGARVLVVGRSPARGAEAVTAIQRVVPGACVEFLAADLSSQAELRSLAAAILERHDRLDVLVNNAGGLFGRRVLSADGIERTFALNHLSYFLLTALLLPALRAAAPARIVNVASEAHRGVTLELANLQGERRYNRWLQYKRSKLENLLFTYRLARGLEGTGVTANALHPGFVATDIGSRHGFIPGILWRIGKLAAIPPEEGARTSVYLAISPDVAGVSGKYFVKSAIATSSPASLDEAMGERLWRISERYVNLPEDAYFA